MQQKVKLHELTSLMRGCRNFFRELEAINPSAKTGINDGVIQDRIKCGIKLNTLAREMSDIVALASKLNIVDLDRMALGIYGNCSIQRISVVKGSNKFRVVTEKPLTGSIRKQPEYIQRANRVNLETQTRTIQEMRDVGYLTQTMRAAVKHVHTNAQLVISATNLGQEVPEKYPHPYSKKTRLGFPTRKEPMDSSFTLPEAING